MRSNYGTNLQFQGALLDLAHRGRLVVLAGPLQSTEYQEFRLGRRPQLVLFHLPVPWALRVQAFRAVMNPVVYEYIDDQFP
jgi:hypothetical protein